MNIRKWLRENSYGDIADLIDKTIADIEAAGLKTRRNWWDTLAGTEDGKPWTVNGVAFPMLRAPRLRKGWPALNGLCRNENEVFPPFVQNGRWPKKKRLPARAKSKAVASKPSRRVQARAS
jgi:hypothetical protein